MLKLICARLVIKPLSEVKIRFVNPLRTKLHWRLGLILNFCLSSNL